MSGDGVYEMLNLKRRERTSYPSRDAQPSLYLSFGFLFPILSSFFPFFGLILLMINSILTLVTLIDAILILCTHAHALSYTCLGCVYGMI